MGRHKNEAGQFVAVGLKIRYEVINLIYQNPKTSIKIPSARELAARFRLSPSTVTLELQKLVRQGYLIGRRGSGTYTNPNACSFPGEDISRRIVGILTGDGKSLFYDAFDWTLFAWCGMAFSSEKAHPRPIQLTSCNPRGAYCELQQLNLSGLIWIHPPFQFRETAQQLHKDKFPVVLLANSFPEIPTVNHDRFQAGRKIGEKLCEEKRHLLYCLASGENDSSYAKRISGITDFIAEHPESKIEVVNFNYCSRDLSPLKQAIARKPPDAVYGNGESIFTLRRILRQAGIDTAEHCRLFAEQPPVARTPDFRGYAIHYPFQEMALKAAEMMQQLFEFPDRSIPSWCADVSVDFIPGTCSS